MDNQQEPTVKHMLTVKHMPTSAQGYVEAWMGGDFRAEWIHVYVWLNPFAVHLKLSQHY